MRDAFVHSVNDFKSQIQGTASGRGRRYLPRAPAPVFRAGFFAAGGAAFL